MNLTLPKIWPAVAATVALSTGMLAISHPAEALLITRTNGLQSGINAPLAAPTVINFASGSVTTTAQSIGTGGLNGGATIQALSGSPSIAGGNLTIGNGNGNNGDGSVAFTFDAVRGIGYLGFNWVNLPQANESIEFFSGNISRGVLTGSQVLANVVGGGTGNYFNFFVTSNNEIFDRIVLKRTAAGTSPFAVDDLAYQAIPTPALLPGLLAMGAGIWRKRKAMAEADVKA